MPGTYLDTKVNGLCLEACLYGSWGPVTGPEIRRIGIFLIFLIFLGLARAVARGKYRDIGLALYVIPVVHYYYVEPVPFSRLLASYIQSGNIREMLGSLGDPYTRYLNKDEYKQLLNQTEGAYGGVGFYTYFKDNQLQS